MGESNFLAIDFGASSGRAMLGKLADGRLTLRELHRFSNDPVELAGRLYWDVPRLFFEIKRALNKAALEGVEIASVGIDTFGQTYDPQKALMAGTIFPELDKPFSGRCKGGRYR